jgi:hypothetical protein
MKHTYICRFGDDGFRKEDAIIVDLANKNQYHYTLWDNNKKKLYKIPHFFTEEAIDLYWISLMVFYADKLIKRDDEPDRWTREMEIYMPVLCVEKWNNNKALFEKMLKYLTGDFWTFFFRRRDITDKELLCKKGLERQKDKMEDKTEFCMLSGGMDSFIGAINLLFQDKKPVFVGNHNGGKGVSIYQKKVIEILSEHYNYSIDNFYQFYAAPQMNGIEGENTTRSRSLLFFAHAILLASGFGHEIKLNIPENGVISLNIPLTIHRMGSLSTRTTHPYYIGMLGELLRNLGIPVVLYNPFQFLTKGEMADKCLDRDFLAQNIEWTMSCSHPDLGRYKHDPYPSHCGTCLPCTIRRVAIAYARMIDRSKYRDPLYDDPNAQINLKSFIMGVRRYRDGKINPSLAIQDSGPLSEDLDLFESVYKRGIEQLGVFLDNFHG